LSRFKYNYLLDGIVTVSESIRETLIASGIRPEIVSVVYEGVDLNWLDGLQPPRLLNGCRRPCVGVVAHLSEEKGHRVLIESIVHLKDRFPKANYILVGDGRLRPELEAEAKRLRVEKQILFTGFRNDSEALMKEFDIFCLPSLSEGLSSAILCAMASALPVVSTGVGGIPELVVDGETGFLVAAGDSSGLAEALAKLLASEQLRQGMGRAGRRRIERLFTLEQKLDGSERFYESLMTPTTIG
jgi:glycosyltransferase involved in cell wall biosynthesis